MSGKVEAKLKQLGYDLPSPPDAVGSYVPVVQTGSLLVTSGQLPVAAREVVFKGKVGAELNEEDARNAARICVLNALAQLKAHLGDLDRVTRVVRMEGYVQSAPKFTAQAQVLNGASELLGQAFGPAGKHTRVAVGVAELPLNAAVEVALWVEAEPA